MAKETKVGLLLGLGVVFLFMCILQWRFGGRAHAELGDANNGAAVATTKVQENTGVACGTDLACNTGSACSDAAAEQPLSIADLHNGLRGRDDDHGLMTTNSDSGTVTNPAVPEQADTGERAAPTQRSAGDLPEPGAAPLSPLDPGTASYTVKPGDSFMKIAKAVLGQGSKWKDIAKLNPGVDSAHLKTGMKLVVPAPALALGRDPGPTAVREPTAAGKRTYTVARGDSLGTISTKMYGTCKKTALIASANKGLNAATLKVGMKLVIPVDPSAAHGSESPTVAPTSAPLDTDTMTAGASRTHRAAPQARGTEPLVDPSAYPDRLDVRAPARTSAAAGGPAEVTTPGPTAGAMLRTTPTSPVSSVITMDEVR